METDRSLLCGCKGIRTCLICEKVYGLLSKDVLCMENSYTFCWKCGKCHVGWNKYGRLDEVLCVQDGLTLPGIYLQPEFISETEEEELIRNLDNIPWTLSQSGRRKQNFGPKCNFKKRKLKLGNFNGFPKCTKFVQDKFEEVEILKGFRTIEQCTLEYDPLRGASIDPHIDDCWIWGERIVTVNLASDCALSLQPYDCVNPTKYNIDHAPDHKPLVNDCIVRVPMPRRSLLILYSQARYAWTHMIFREDILSRRICLAYREFTKPYLPKGKLEKESEEIFNKSLNFFQTI